MALILEYLIVKNNIKKASAIFLVVSVAFSAFYTDRFGGLPSPDGTTQNFISLNASKTSLYTVNS